MKKDVWCPVGTRYTRADLINSAIKGEGGLNEEQCVDLNVKCPMCGDVVWNVPAEEVPVDIKLNRFETAISCVCGNCGFIALFHRGVVEKKEKKNG